MKTKTAGFNLLAKGKGWMIFPENQWGSLNMLILPILSIIGSEQLGSAVLQMSIRKIIDAPGSSTLRKIPFPSRSSFDKSKKTRGNSRVFSLVRVNYLALKKPRRTATTSSVVIKAFASTSLTNFSISLI